MSQHDMNIANQGFPAFRSDMNDALSALATTSAGTAEPSTTFANQLWYDSTNDLLKMRNSDNDAWITLAYFDQVADEWQLRSAVIQAVDAAGVQIKTDEGTTRIDIQDDGDVSIDSGTLFVDATNNRVGINTSSPADQLDISGTVPKMRLTDTDGSAYHTIRGSGNGSLELAADEGNTGGLASSMTFRVDGTERMRIDSYGNLLVGTTTTAVLANDGIRLNPTGLIDAGNTDAQTMRLSRNGTDGDILQFYQGVTKRGAIGTGDGSAVAVVFHNTSSGIGFYGNGFAPVNGSGIAVDNSKDVGSVTYRFDDVYATNGTIQTSDRNEKQDIEELSEAEQRVAVAAKALMRKFRWKDAVAEKGDDARIHFGIIAQDLQAAFEAEGLDAGRYAMFISSTWWEHEVEVPAVAEEVDEDGNVITEAKEAYTRTDTYDTAEEAPEGAVERTRLGVRYPELLAFIIAAI